MSLFLRKETFHIVGKGGAPHTYKSCGLSNNFPDTSLFPSSVCARVCVRVGARMRACVCVREKGGRERREVYTAKNVVREKDLLLHSSVFRVEERKKTKLGK